MYVITVLNIVLIHFITIVNIFTSRDQNFYSRQPKIRLIRIRLNRSQITYIYTQRSSGLRLKTLANWNSTTTHAVHFHFFCILDEPCDHTV
jgi:hypothetical protein